jgi:hypothetical protein
MCRRAARISDNYDAVKSHPDNFVSREARDLAAASVDASRGRRRFSFEHTAARRDPRPDSAPFARGHNRCSTLAISKEW